MTAYVPALPPAVEAAIAALRDRPIAATEKGFGVIAAGGPVGADGGDHRPGADLPGVRDTPRAAGQRADRPHGDLMAGRRDGGRPRLRLLPLRRQPGRCRPA